MLCRCCQSQAISQYGVRRVVNNVLMHKHLRIILGSKSAEDYQHLAENQQLSDQRWGRARLARARQAASIKANRQHKREHITQKNQPRFEVGF